MAAIRRHRDMEHILEHDRPQASSAQALRNASIEGGARARLTIVPEPCTLKVRDRVAEPMRGEFLDYPDPMTLGKRRTDAAGRPVFTGCDGCSDSTRGRTRSFCIAAPPSPVPPPYATLASFGSSWAPMRSPVRAATDFSASCIRCA